MAISSCFDVEAPDGIWSACWCKPPWGISLPNLSEVRASRELWWLADDKSRHVVDWQIHRPAKNFNPGGMADYSSDCYFRTETHKSAELGFLHVNVCDAVVVEVELLITRNKFCLNNWPRLVWNPFQSHARCSRCSGPSFLTPPWHHWFPPAKQPDFLYFLHTANALKNWF